ncbi:MAG: hypothetical protein CBC13_06160 [Planctomycetia bacterium TMED53]|nr:MAG: hypothetical protein CBC13_06160 [Planctomycetia bacterium TMED53]
MAIAFPAGGPGCYRGVLLNPPRISLYSNPLPELRQLGQRGYSPESGLDSDQNRTDWKIER